MVKSLLDYYAYIHNRLFNFEIQKCGLHIRPIFSCRVTYMQNIREYRSIVAAIINVATTITTQYKFTKINVANFAPIKF